MVLEGRGFDEVTICGEVGEKVAVKCVIDIFQEVEVGLTEIEELLTHIKSAEGVMSGLGAPEYDIAFVYNVSKDIKISKRGDVCVFTEVYDFIFAAECFFKDGAIIAEE